MATATVDPKVFEGLSITPSDEPLPAITRGSTAGPNPFRDPLLASIEHGRAYSLYIPANAVQRAVFLINQAAKRENKGVRVVANVQRDANGKIVKGTDGKAQYVVEVSGPNKGKVLVRFQGKNERKQQTAPRPYSIVKNKKDGTYVVRRRSDKHVMGTHKTHDLAKAQYDDLKSAYLAEQEKQSA